MPVVLVSKQAKLLLTPLQQYNPSLEPHFGRLSLDCIAALGAVNGKWIGYLVGRSGIGP